jgi:hypothetical protein
MLEGKIALKDNKTAKIKQINQKKGGRVNRFKK